jgi:hypothetical protein
VGGGWLALYIIGAYTQKHKHVPLVSGLRLPKLHRVISVCVKYEYEHRRSTPALIPENGIYLYLSSYLATSDTLSDHPFTQSYIGHKTSGCLAIQISPLSYLS